MDVQLVVSDRKLFDFEVGFKSISDFVSSGLGDVAVEDFKLDKVAVVLDELGYCL